MKKIIFTDGQIEDFIEFYKKTKNLSELERKFGFNRKVIGRVLREAGCDIRNIKQHRLNFTDDQKKNLVDSYKNGASINQISEMYNCERTLVTSIINKEGISTSRKRYMDNSVKFDIDEDFFENINNEYKAYILGFIVADGCVYGTKLMIVLHIKDTEILNKINESLKSTYKLSKKNNKYINLTISSKKIVSDLKSLGISERKSWGMDFDKILSNIPTELKRHFLRGIFDGDGCIGIYKQTHYERYTYHFSITGNKFLVEWCKSFLNIDNKIVQDKRSEYAYYCLTRNKCKIKDIRDIIYKDAHIYMERKYKKFNEIV